MIRKDDPVFHVIRLTEENHERNTTRLTVEMPTEDANWVLAVMQVWDSRQVITVTEGVSNLGLRNSDEMRNHIHGILRRKLQDALAERGHTALFIGEVTEDATGPMDVTEFALRALALPMSHANPEALGIDLGDRRTIARSVAHDPGFLRFDGPDAPMMTPESHPPCPTPDTVRTARRILLSQHGPCTCAVGACRREECDTCAAMPTAWYCYNNPIVDTPDGGW